MDQRIERPRATPERRRTVAAWEALERAEVLLPADHPAAWHLAQALAAMEAAWREQGAGGERAAPMPCQDDGQATGRASRRPPAP